MKSILFVAIFVFVGLTAGIFAQTTSEKTQLAKQIKADHDIGNSVKEITSEMIIKEIDLNADGKPEYIVHGIPGFCGAGQCVHFKYRKFSTKFVNISEYGIDGVTYKIEKTRTKGFLNISFTEKGASGRKKTVYKFNGNNYQ